MNTTKRSMSTIVHDIHNDAIAVAETFDKLSAELENEVNKSYKLERGLSSKLDELETVNAAYQDLSKENSTMKSELKRLKKSNDKMNRTLSRLGKRDLAMKNEIRKLGGNWKQFNKGDNND